MAKVITLVDGQGNKCYPRTLMENVYGLPSQVKRIDNLIGMVTSSAVTDMAEVIDARTVGETTYDTLHEAMNAINDKVDDSITIRMSQTTNQFTDYVSTNNRDTLTIVYPPLGVTSTVSNSHCHVRCILYDENYKKIADETLTSNTDELDISKASYIQFYVEMYVGASNYYPKVTHDIKYKLSKNLSINITQDEQFIHSVGSKMAEALPKDDGFMSKVGNRIGSFIDQTLPKNDEFMTGVGKRIGSFWDGNCASQTAYALANNTASYLPSFMASYCASDSMFMSKMAEALPSDSTFINSVGRKMAKADSFCNELASSPPFGSAVLTNALVSLELSKYVPKTATVCGVQIRDGIAPATIADKVAPYLPSRLGFFGIFQTITTPNESGKEYFKFEDYSIKGKYSINSDRNKINIPRKLLSIKVRGNFSGAQSCKNCKICGEVIDENNKIVFTNFEIFRVKAGSDADGLVTEAQPFNAEYILNADLDDSSLGNKTLYIRFYVKYDTMAYFYSVSSCGDCSVTITEI